MVRRFIGKRSIVDPDSNWSCTNGAWGVSDTRESEGFYLHMVPEPRIRTSESQTATIYLGAAATITGGLLTYFKSRNQPNRARQFRQALKSVRNNMDDQSHKLAGLTTEQARAAAQDIIKQYHDALHDAAVNYPDLWVISKDNSHGDQPGNTLSDLGPNLDKHGPVAPTPAVSSKQHESRTVFSETQTKLDSISA